MEEKRCEWCGTISPVDAERCVLCRIAFTIAVPPPQDWSHLTGNIPVITAPLLEEEPAHVASPAEDVAAQDDAIVAEPVTPQYLVAQDVVQQAAVAQEFPGLTPEAVTVPDWRAPDDPTLQVFRERLVERERRPRPSRAKPRRRFRRFAVWTVALLFIAAALLLALIRFPGF